MWHLPLLCMINVLYHATCTQNFSNKNQKWNTQETAKALTDFLNFCAANPDAKATYGASDMILYNQSDASYLVATKSELRSGGYKYLGNNVNNKQIISCPIAIIAKIIQVVMASAVEAEVGAL